MADWLVREGKVEADLSKKPADQSFPDGEFGVDGSFRKLRFD